MISSAGSSPFYLPPPPQPALPIAGEAQLFAVRRIWCVGRNYAAHAREMGSDPTREAPFFFAKPADALVSSPLSAAHVAYPPQTKNFHHEVELVVAIGTAGRNISVDQALGHVIGYAVGIDLTRRDLQNAAKDRGQPWAMGKGFDASAPCSALQLAANIGHPSQGAIELRLNGQSRQFGHLQDMIWSVAETIAHLSKLVGLAPGDLIFTGTPEGVGPLQIGDLIDARIEGVGTLSCTIDPPTA